MTCKVLIAHAKGEDDLAAKLAGPLRAAGYDAEYEGTVLVGESVVEEASKVLQLGGPVVLCATVRALGTAWARRVVASVRRHDGVRVFIVQCEEDADVDLVSFDEKVARYWQDPAKALKDLLDALTRYYPLDRDQAEVRHVLDAEERYRELLLKSCDLLSLANLPEQDRHLAQRQLELRRLFVPLHARVEARVGDGEGDKRLAALEDARGGAWAVFLTPRAPVGARLREARRLVVLGDPGAGKTTLTRWLATAYLLRLKRDPDWAALPDVQTLPDEDWLPILVRCRDLDTGGAPVTLDDILRGTLRASELSDAHRAALVPLLRGRLDEGRALLLLDGLDEIAEPGRRQRLCEQLERIHDACPQAAIVATSRIVGYREMGYRLGRGFEHLTLADLKPDEKDDFVRRWCALTEPDERQARAAEELIRDIHGNDRIERLTGNPMLLTTMALVKRKVGKLPSRRADLYREAVEVLLHWRGDVDQPIEWQEAVPQLAYVAYAMCDRGVQRLRRDEILDLLRGVRADYPSLHRVQRDEPEDFLRRVEARTGLLVEAGHARHVGLLTPVYEFRHLTFQEYLAARALVGGHFPGRNAGRSLAEHVGPLAGRIAIPAARDLFEEPEAGVIESWRETLRLCTAICLDADVDATLEAILIPQADEPPEHGRARAVQAALCLADEPNASGATAQRILDALAHHARSGDGDGGSPTGIDSAAMELATTRWVEPLRDSLAREFAQRPYATRSDPGALYALVAAESTDGDAEWQTTGACAPVGDDAIAVLRAALAAMQIAWEQCRHRRASAAWEPAYTQRLALALTHGLSGEPALAHACAWALGWMSHISQPQRWVPDERARERILAVMASPDADPEALRWLSCVVQFAPDAAFVDVLLPLILHPHTPLRDNAATALGEIRDERAVEPLIARLDDPDAGVRCAVAGALGAIRSQRAVEPLIARLDDLDANVLYAVGNALSKIRSERAVEPLIARLDDPDANVRDAVVGALGAIGGERVRQVMAPRLEHADADVRRQAVRALSSQLDATTRTLLTSDLYEWGPRRDPREPVTLAFAQRAATKLQFSLDDVKARYEALAPQFHLRLEWLTDAPASTPATVAKP